MLQRETLALTRRICKERCRIHSPYLNPAYSQASFVRYMSAAVGKASKATKQNWRKTRHKIGPSTSNTTIIDAEKDVAEAIRVEKVSLIKNASKLITPDIDELSELASSWVPPAYRGTVDDTRRESRVTRHRSASMRSNGMVRPRRVSAPRTDRFILHSKDDVVDVFALGLPQNVIFAKQKKEESVTHDVQALLKVSLSYRNHLRGIDATTDTDTDNDDDPEPSTLPTIGSFKNQIASALHSIHSESVTDRKYMDDSAEDFKSLCQFLQQICSTACNLATLRKYNDQDASSYVDLAEFTLVQLVQINHDRSKLLIRKKDMSYEKTMTSMVNQIVSGILPVFCDMKSGQNQKKDEDRDQREKLTIDKAQLHSMMRLLKNVIATIASTIEKPVLPLVAQAGPSCEGNGNVDEKCLHEKVTQRMLALLDTTSSLGIVDPVAVYAAMEVMSRSGSLIAARLCFDTFKKYKPLTGRHSFTPSTLVLEAYLEAIKREASDDINIIIVEEVMNVHTSMCKSTNRAERILQTSIVLNILAVANMGKVYGMCASGELLVKRALGGTRFALFLTEIESKYPDINNGLVPVPIANYLAQLYATSGQPELERTARKLLKYTMIDSDGYYAMTTFPTNETCNAVLQTLVQSADMNDYIFARKVLQLMFNKTDLVCWPNQTTYDGLFDLLESVNPADIGIAGEELLTYIETANLFYASSTFSLPISTYHRVLKYYLQMAQKSTPFLSVSEENMPYRRAAHILRQLEIRSTPLVLSDLTLKDLDVENLYRLAVRPNVSTYQLVMQICANTSQAEYQEEAADVAFEIHRTRSDYDSNSDLSWDTVLENCTNETLVARVRELTYNKM